MGRTKLLGSYQISVGRLEAIEHLLVSVFEGDHGVDHGEWGPHHLVVVDHQVLGHVRGNGVDSVDEQVFIHLGFMGLLLVSWGEGVISWDGGGRLGVRLCPPRHSQHQEQQGVE